MGAVKGAAGANRDPNAQVNEGPLRSVSLGPFLISKYEVTQAQWKRVMGSNPSKHWPGGAFPGVTLAHPVENVSWTDCQTFARRLGLRLPSESQWEYVARAGTRTVWWTGNRKASLSNSQARGVAENVGDQSYTKVSRQIGESWDDGAAIHEDMDGSYADAPSDGSASTNSDPARVRRGGSWGGDANYSRSGYRDYREPKDRSANLGLRLVASVAD
jgi:formylglycine-generating enzyme required for sulfatase activity